MTMLSLLRDLLFVESRHVVPTEILCWCIMVPSSAVGSVYGVRLQRTI